MRLDVFLAENGIVDSRTDAKNFIISGAVTVNGRVVQKPALDINGDENIEVDKSNKRYVSRGGFKLESALDNFRIDPSGLVAIDVGASSGGFTDCLLQRGASFVIAVDSGSGQMAEKLRLDKRVMVVENFNARYMSATDFELTPMIAVMDVSFISARLIIPAVYSVLGNGGQFVCLIKPQFEVGKGGLNKRGVVKSDSLREKAVNDVVECGRAVGFTHCGLIDSPILGGDGNKEYLCYFRK